ncbi:gamma-glutamyl-gamma-aminobutyrate hydrolase family protein [Rhodococcus sp. NPDC056960]|uniref:gamma-glutamyl-gamma-aminobutyrate hydrolase family protein n=1 Tax=Rhodococcus sp. NPDC056960 TaxID=3345982 RepID=UPI0036458ADA
MRPLIGITGRCYRLEMVTGTSPRFTDRLTNSFFTDFDRCVAEAGGIPVNLPFVSSSTGVADRLDGLIVTGGQDVHPSRWGGMRPVDPDADPRRNIDVIDFERDQYEADLISDALSLGIPILGVCRGHQLLNTVLGGTLIEDIEETSVVHSSPKAAPYAGDDNHVVELFSGSVGRQIYGARRTSNSWHHQAVDRPGVGLAVTGRATDGIAEMIELSGRPVVGVQWHPEWQTERDPIFDWLIERCAWTMDERQQGRQDSKVG